MAPSLGRALRDDHLRMVFCARKLLEGQERGYERSHFLCKIHGAHKVQGGRNFDALSFEHPEAVVVQKSKKIGVRHGI